jgi:hypothetical protein
MRTLGIKGAPALSLMLESADGHTRPQKRNLPSMDGYEREYNHPSLGSIVISRYDKGSSRALEDWLLRGVHRRWKCAIKRL